MLSITIQTDLCVYMCPNWFSPCPTNKKEKQNQLSPVPAGPCAGVVRLPFHLQGLLECLFPMTSQMKPGCPPRFCFPCTFSGGRDFPSLTTRPSGWKTGSDFLGLHGLRTFPPTQPSASTKHVRPAEPPFLLLTRSFACTPGFSTLCTEDFSSQLRLGFFVPLLLLRAVTDSQ